jgi:hypothetical protein
MTNLARANTSETTRQADGSIPDPGPDGRMLALGTGGRPPARPHADARRPLALAGLALVALGGYLAIWPLMPAAIAGTLSPIALVVTAEAVPYALACWLLLRAPAPTSARWRRAEWAILIAGALLFRAALLPLVPVLSRDAYRYAWDALVTAHGFSPYLHAPNWPGFDALRDVFYGHVPWKTVPTIYPPGAQLLYRAAYLIAPKNFWVVKAEMVVFDLLAGLLLALLLRRHGQDPRRAFIYLWAPLPVVEYALNGHVDAAAIALTLLVLLVNELRFRGARALVGALLGFATLVKLYPAIFVVALVRRRDWSLLTALVGVVALGYLPFWHEGLAAFGFLGTYLNQTDSNFGGAALALRGLANFTHLSANGVRALEALGAAVGVALVFCLRAFPASALTSALKGRSTQADRERSNTRLRLAAVRRSFTTALGAVWALVSQSAGNAPGDAPLLSPIQATYALVALWLAFSPHVFAWYVPALLPFCALYLAGVRRAPLRPAGAVVNDRRTGASVNAARGDQSTEASTGAPETVYGQRGAPVLQGRERGIAAACAAGIWAFCCLIPLSYVAFEVPRWAWLYPALYPACLGLALGLWLRWRR